MTKNNLIRQLETVYCTNFIEVSNRVFESENTFKDREGEYKLLLAIFDRDRVLIHKLRKEPTALLSLN